MSRCSPASLRLTCPLEALVVGTQSVPGAVLSPQHPSFSSSPSLMCI